MWNRSEALRGNGISRVMRMKASLLLVIGLTLAGPAYAAVGYRDVYLTNGYNFVCLQLDADGTGTNNNIYNSFGTNAPDGTKVYLWDVTNQVFTAPSIYSAASRTWTTNYSLPIGRGFVVEMTEPWTLTVVGAVLEGYFTNLIAGNNKLSLVSFMVPLQLDLSGMQFPGIDGANVCLFKTPSQTYSDAFTYFSRYGWFDPNGVVNTNGPAIAVGQAFFVRSPAPDTNWVQYFKISQSDLTVSVSSISPKIRSLSLSKTVATLHLSNPKAVSYNVQFSTDCLTWTMVATNQTGSIWQGARPGSARGYYRLMHP